MENAPPLCRIGELPAPMDAASFGLLVKQSLGCGLRYFDAGVQIRSVAVCGGSGGKLWSDAAAAGADAYLTGDGLDYNNAVLPALGARISLFDAGHFSTESIILPSLTEKMKASFKNIEWIISKTNRNPYRYME